MITPDTTSGYLRITSGATRAGVPAHGGRRVWFEVVLLTVMQRQRRSGHAWGSRRSVGGRRWIVVRRVCLGNSLLRDIYE